MIKKGDKKGQFYLIAAIAISIITISLVSINNYSKRDYFFGIDVLEKEISFEIESLSDYILEKNLNENQKYESFIDFSKNNIKYIGKDKDIYFIFGNRKNITIYGYQNYEKTINISSNGISDEKAFQGENSLSINDEGGNINNLEIFIDEKNYNFEILSGDNFYFIISKGIKGEEYIIIG